MGVPACGGACGEVDKKGVGGWRVVYVVVVNSSVSLAQNILADYAVLLYGTFLVPPMHSSTYRYGVYRVNRVNREAR